LRARKMLKSAVSPNLDEGFEKKGNVFNEIPWRNQWDGGKEKIKFLEKSTGETHPVAWRRKNRSQNKSREPGGPVSSSTKA